MKFLNIDSLIDIKPIKKCVHPRERIEIAYIPEEPRPRLSMVCECGARVQPKEFEEVP